MEKSYNIIKSETRGHADHGWLVANHSFSFANYYDPERVRFGALRVLNDDTIAGGEGFGKHPHDNMEIITIPLSGELKHGDSMGNSSVIKAGEIQVMSAGTGVFHSEMNNSDTQPAQILQIWIYPQVKGVLPRYDQRSIYNQDSKEIFKTVVTPRWVWESGDAAKSYPQSIWINQNAWITVGDLVKEQEEEYSIKTKDNGLYIFVIEGEIHVDMHQLYKRDAVAITGARDVKILAKEDAKILLIDVPLKW